MVKENDEFLKKTLKPEQRKRLKQIAMQTAGFIWVCWSSDFDVRFCSAGFMGKNGRGPNDRAQQA
jgi:hypothetical protein